MAKIGPDDKPTAEQLPVLPEEEAPVVEYPKYVKRLDEDGNVVEEVLVQNEAEEKAVKANWVKDDAKDAKKEAKAEEKAEKKAEK